MPLPMGRVGRPVCDTPVKVAQASGRLAASRSARGAPRASGLRLNDPTPEFVGRRPLFFSARLVLLVQGQTFPTLLTVFLLEGGILQGFFLPLHGLGKLANLGIGRRESVQKGRRLPVTQITGFPGVFDRFLAIADVAFRTDCPEPGHAIVDMGVFRVEAEGLGEIGEGFTVVLLGLVVLARAM